MAVDRDGMDSRGFYARPRGCGCGWPSPDVVSLRVMRGLEPSPLAVCGSGCSRVHLALEHSRKVDGKNRLASACWLVYHAIDRVLIYEGREWLYRDEQIVSRLHPRREALRSAAEWLWPRSKGIGGGGRATREAMETVADAVLYLPLQPDDDGVLGFDVAEFGTRIGAHRAVEYFKYPDRKLRKLQLRRRAQAAQLALTGSWTDSGS